MINSMTVVLCNKLCAFGIFPKSQEKIYIYGFELLLSSVIGIMVLMMISITRGTAFAWLSYLLGFIPVRITGGGYHAKTHFTCILSFSLLFLIFLLSSSFIDIQSITYIFLSLTTLIISLAVAPVEAINKPLSNERRSKIGKMLKICNHQSGDCLGNLGCENSMRSLYQLILFRRICCWNIHDC